MAMCSASEAFFAQLPKDHLVPSEASLLQLLHDIGSAVESLLPRSVSLQQWAQIRVPAQHIQDINKAGLVWISPRDDVQHGFSSTRAASKRPSPPVQLGVRKRQLPPVPPPLPPPPKLHVSRSGSTDFPRADSAVAGRQASAPDHSHFFDQLPTDGFVPAEELLRDRVIQLLHRLTRWRHNTLEKMMQFEDIAEAANDLLPRGVSMLFEWIERRLGEEIEVRHDCHKDAPIIRLINTRAANPEAYEEELHAFLGSLPPDSFTDEEAALRDAILALVKGWQGSGPPRLTDAGSDALVKTARQAFLPPSISLKLWMEARVGQELELLQDASGQYAIGLPGQLDSAQIAATVIRSRKPRIRPGRG